MQLYLSTQLAFDAICHRKDTSLHFPAKRWLWILYHIIFIALHYQAFSIWKISGHLLSIFCRWDGVITFSSETLLKGIAHRILRRHVGIKSMSGHADANAFGTPMVIMTEFASRISTTLLDEILSFDGSYHTLRLVFLRVHAMKHT